MLRNPIQALRDLLPAPVQQIGTVAAVADGSVRVTLPGGGTIIARGTAEVGDQVFVMDGVIQSLAPALPIVLIDV